MFPPRGWELAARSDQSQLLLFAAPSSALNLLPLLTTKCRGLHHQVLGENTTGGSVAGVSLPGSVLSTSWHCNASSGKVKAMGKTQGAVSVPCKQDCHLLHTQVVSWLGYLQLHSSPVKEIFYCVSMRADSRHERILIQKQENADSGSTVDIHCVPGGK